MGWRLFGFAVLLIVATFIFAPHGAESQPERQPCQWSHWWQFPMERGPISQPPVLEEPERKS